MNEPVRSDEFLRLQAELKFVRQMKHRAKCNELTDEDRKYIDRLQPPTSVKNYGEGVQWAENELKRQLEAAQKGHTSQGLLFPLPDGMDGMPNIFARGKLFRPVARGRRAGVTNEVVSEWGDWRITYTGFTLDEADRDVKLAVQRAYIHASRAGNVEFITGKNGVQEYGRIFVSARGLLRSMGRSTGGSDYQWLHSSLDRLGGKLRITKQRRQAFSGSLISNWAHDPDSDLLAIDLNLRYAPMWDDGYTLIGHETRRSLKTQFTKWLHMFICSNVATKEKPHYMTVQKIMDSAGIKRDARRWASGVLRPSLQALVDHGVLVEFTIKRGRVSWVRGKNR